MPKVLMKIDKGIGIIEEVVAVTGFVVVAVITVAQVFWRYVLNAGILWSDEVITTFMVMMVMFGTAGMTRRKLHTELLVFVNKLPIRFRKIVRILTGLIGLAFLCVFLYSSTRYTFSTKGMVTTVMRIPMQYLLALLPVGALLSIYEYIKTFPSIYEGDISKPSDTDGESAEGAAK